MTDVYLKISGAERMRIERIVLDRDAEDALKLVALLLERIDSAERGGMKSHLDAH